MMLRITVYEEAESLTLQLEGGLAGPWVQEAEYCWQRALAGQSKSVLSLNLAGVTFIDLAGKAFLAWAHAQGAKLIACGCLMRAIVAELTGSPVPVGTGTCQQR